MNVTTIRAWAKCEVKSRLGERALFVSPGCWRLSPGGPARPTDAPDFPWYPRANNRRSRVDGAEVVLLQIVPCLTRGRPSCGRSTPPLALARPLLPLPQPLLDHAWVVFGGGRAQLHARAWSEPERR